MKRTDSQTASTPEPGAAPPSRRRPTVVLLVAFPSILIVLAAYAWFVSRGTWNRWSDNSSYYDQLASAFAHGQLHLEAVPHPAILALMNPYDPSARKDLPFLSDASLYGGKYYLYFGPLPAVLLAFIKIILPFHVGDQQLTFVFTSGVFLLLSLLLVEIWKRFAHHTPAWIVSLSILAMGLTTPFAWILSSPAAVHDAAISAGQCFFLAGLYAALRALEHTPAAPKWAAAAGVFWAASLCARITQVLPIALVVALWIHTEWRAGRDQSTARGPSRTILFLAIPLLVAGVALAWYNWARFGSVTETGIKYQLALLPIQRYPDEITAVRYVPQNAYNYLLMPPKVRYNFPYLWPQMGIRRPILPWISLSPLYFAENITGLAFTAPLLLFVFALLGGRGTPFATSVDDRGKGRQLNWLLASLCSSSSIGFGFFLLFFWASHRYLLDFLPPALLLSVIGFWRLLNLTQAMRIRHAAVIVFGLCLFGMSIVVSNLVSIGLNADEFRSLNPELWMRLNNVFRP